jgi:hypothetical protein
MGEDRRKRGRGLTITAVVVACLGLLGVAVLREAPASEAVEFIPVGHWVYRVADEAAYHVDGSTGQVDGRVGVPGAESDSQVAQGNGSGYVVERKRITIFDESTLHVEDAVDTPATERPVVLEVAGGPYLVYRNAGQVVRLGDPMATVAAGGPLTTPVATGDGTVWLHRIDSGALCMLPRGTTRLSCPAQLDSQHQGVLTVVGDRAALVDTTADTVTLLQEDGFGVSRPLGFDVPASARVAAADAGGRLALLDTEHRSMHLVDTAGLDGRPESAPITVDLPEDGEFDGPVAAANVVAVVNTAANELLTYDSTGERRETTKLPEVKEKDGSPRLVSGEDDRIYVDSPDGSHVLVVDGSDGSVLDVPVVVPDPDAEDEVPGTTDEDQDKDEKDQPQAGPTENKDEKPDQDEPRDEPRRERQQPRREPEPKVQTAPPVASATPPGVPGAVSAVAAHQSATVSWRPAAENGAPVTAYVLSWPGGSTRVAGTAGRATVSGLTNGTSYRIAVAAENSAGRGPAASAAAVIPLRAAAAPKVDAPASFGMQTVTWNQPELYGGTLVHYLVSVTGQADQTTTEPSIMLSFANLSGTVTVRAVTRFGPSGASTVTGQPGSAELTMPADFPSVQIATVAWVVVGGDQLTVTVNATSQSAATCTVTAAGKSASGPCKGETTFTVAGVVPDATLGTVQVSADIDNTAGNAGVGATWYGTPQDAPAGGGFVLWLGPAAFAASAWWTTRRNTSRNTRKREETVP